MDWVHLAILGIGIGFVFGGARLLYCGHQRAVRHDRRSTDHPVAQ